MSFRKAVTPSATSPVHSPWPRVRAAMSFPFPRATPLMRGSRWSLPRRPCPRGRGPERQSSAVRTPAPDPRLRSPRAGFHPVRAKPCAASESCGRMTAMPRAREVMKFGSPVHASMRSAAVMERSVRAVSPPPETVAGRLPPADAFAREPGLTIRDSGTDCISSGSPECVTTAKIITYGRLAHNISIAALDGLLARV